MPFVILLVVDGSSHSVSAARYALAIIAGSSASFALRPIHVQYRSPPRPAAALGRAIVKAYYRSETEEAVTATKRLLGTGAVPHQPVIRIGNPVTEIVRYARSEQVARIVMGPHGRGAMTGLLPGSVTQKTIDRLISDAAADRAISVSTNGTMRMAQELPIRKFGVSAGYRTRDAIVVSQP